MTFNPILLEVFKNKFSSIAEEMGVTLIRTSFSPNIKERKDCSCAIFDRNGNMVEQAAHIPVHLGSMQLSVKAAIDAHDMNDGDMVILNDPYRGGTHLPDITVVAPVYCNTPEPVFYVANRAHHSDVGGMSPGSMPLSTSIFQEGIIIPPLKLVEKGKIDRKLMDFFLSNVRIRDEREGDFEAQIMANITGINRLRELLDNYGRQTVLLYGDELQNYSERIVRTIFRDIPDGEYSFVDYLDDDGVHDHPIKIEAIVIVDGDTMSVDFSGSDPQVDGSVNAVYAITLSCVLYVIRSLAETDIPTNAGCLRPITVITRKGSVVDAEYPAAVAAGNVETSQRIVDVLLGALSKAMEGKIPAASQGTMNNITIGGIDERTGRHFSYYETIGGGMGASSGQNGASAVHSHMTNTMNTPVEALEYTYPFLITEYKIRKNSGGDGQYKGGDGIIRRIKLLSDAFVTVLSERRKFCPYPLEGGQPGKKGQNIVVSQGEKQVMPGKFSRYMKKGDELIIETPGGGGWGKGSGSTDGDRGNEGQSMG